jgi:hypothetical protein
MSLATNEETKIKQHTFCPVEHHDTVIEIMEQHFCTHPLVPAYLAQMSEGNKAWAVKQTYEFCILHNLPNPWAYWCGRWELWACSGNPREIG